MPHRRTARTAGRRTRSAVVAAILAAVAVLTAMATLTMSLLGYPAAVDSWSPTTSAETITFRPPDDPPRDHRRARDADDAVLPDGTTVIEDDRPGVTGLDPTLLRALRRAAAHAERDGVKVYVNSGWRSRAEQERLFREAVSKYGSAREAKRWVATPGTSAHEKGKAVDLGHSDATAWLSERGARYGLCQIYRNEPWHYELRPEAADRGCPPSYADPTQDPRMHR